MYLKLARREGYEVPEAQPRRIALLDIEIYVSVPASIFSAQEQSEVWRPKFSRESGSSGTDHRRKEDRVLFASCRDTH